MESNSYNSETLKIVRDYMGLSQTAFAEKIGISQSLISKIEKGQKVLEEDIVEKCSDYFNENFFKKNIDAPNQKLFYRKLVSTPKSTLNLFESRLSLISVALKEVLEIVDLPESKIPKIDAEDFNLNFEEIATTIRLELGLNGKPIKNIVSLLEKNGVIIHFFDYPFISPENKKFDGVSFYIEGTPIMLINNKIPNSRKVFTIAHELFHLIAHFDDIISINRDIEDEANKFASAFIAPEQEIKNSLKRLSFDKLCNLKSEWKLSISALLYRAKDLGTISLDTYRWWITKLAKYRKNEPYEFELDNTQLLGQAFELILNEENNFFYDLGYKDIVVNELFNTVIAIPNKKKTETKLRVVI